MANINFERAIEMIGSAPNGPPPDQGRAVDESFVADLQGEPGNDQGSARPPHVWHHLADAWARRAAGASNVHMFHYNDLKADLHGEIKRLAAALGFSPNNDDVRRYAASATFETMRDDSATVAPDAHVGL